MDIQDFAFRQSGHWQVRPLKEEQPGATHRSHEHPDDGCKDDEAPPDSAGERTAVIGIGLHLVRNGAHDCWDRRFRFQVIRFSRACKSPEQGA